MNDEPALNLCSIEDLGRRLGWVRGVLGQSGNGEESDGNRCQPGRAYRKQGSLQSGRHLWNLCWECGIALVNDGQALGSGSIAAVGQSVDWRSGRPCNRLVVVRKLEPHVPRSRSYRSPLNLAATVLAGWAFF